MVGPPIPDWGDDPYDSEHCPPISWLDTWEWVQGACTGNAVVFSECYDWDRPEYPPEWYPEILTNVLRMRLKWI